MLMNFDYKYFNISSNEYVIAVYSKINLSMYTCTFVITFGHQIQRHKYPAQFDIYLD